MSRLIHLLLLFGAFVLPAFPAAHAREEAWEEEMQFEARNQVKALIKAFNTTHDQRKQFVNELYKMALGKQRQMILQQLRQELLTCNSQVTEGILEVFARLNDPVILPMLEEELLYNPALDVRLNIIEHLPLFCVMANKDRDDLLRFLENGQRHLPEELIQTMRMPPVNPQTGRYDLSLDEDVRGRVEGALTAQLDPVDAIIENGLEQRNQARALAMLKQMLAVDLGHLRTAWLEYWKSRGKSFVSPIQSDLLDSQISACRMLGYLGAEGKPALVERIRWLLSTPHTTARQSALEMLREIIAYWVAQGPQMEQALRAPGLRQPEEIWIKRRQEGVKRLLALAQELGTAYAADSDPVIRMALVDCLGATARPEAVGLIAQALRTDGQSQPMRTHVIQALGEVGGTEAELLLEQMAAFRGISVEKNEQIDEYHRVHLAFDSLGQIAGRLQNGRIVNADKTAAGRAVEFLLAQLADSRRFPGATAHANPERQTVQFLARATLQTILQDASESYDPAYWRTAWNTAASTR